MTTLEPRTIVGNPVAFAQRFKRYVLFATDRRHTEAYAFRSLERWVRDRDKM